jgi:hypothetical protein
MLAVIGNADFMHEEATQDTNSSGGVDIGDIRLDDAVWVNKEHTSFRRSF